MNIEGRILPAPVFQRHVGTNGKKETLGIKRCSARIHEASDALFFVDCCENLGISRLRIEKPATGYHAEQSRPASEKF